MLCFSAFIGGVLIYMVIVYSTQPLIKLYLKALKISRQLGHLSEVCLIVLEKNIAVKIIWKDTQQNSNLYC